MCRILMFNKKGLELLESEIGLVTMLDHLEKECGGHGNGIALSNGKRVAYLAKGVNYNNKKIAKELLERDFKYALYHTRVTSSGKISNANCHPFLKEHVCLAMNGTESSFAAIARTYDKTDTEMVLDTFLKLNIPLEKLQHLSANYMGFDHGKPYISNSSNLRNCLEILQEGDAWIVASSFPKGIKSEELTPGYWKEGDVFKIRKPVVHKTYTGKESYLISADEVDKYEYGLSESYKDYSRFTDLNAWKRIGGTVKEELTKEEKDIKDLNSN